MLTLFVGTGLNNEYSDELIKKSRTILEWWSGLIKSTSHKLIKLAASLMLNEEDSKARDNQQCKMK